MNKSVIDQLYFEIWSKGDLDLVKILIADTYTIHNDPGDAWEGKSLNHDEYCKRVVYSRNAFPDLKFKIFDVIQERELFAVRWSAEGTHLGDLNQLPATKKVLTFSGQTFYKIIDGKFVGHWQVVDRLGFIQQLSR